MCSRAKNSAPAVGSKKHGRLFLKYLTIKYAFGEVMTNRDFYMISDVLNTIKNIKPFFLLNIFLTLSMTLMVCGQEILIEPISLKAFSIPVLGIISYALVWYWIVFVIWLKHFLPRKNFVNLGAWLACSILTFALLLTFSYLGVSYKNGVGELIGRPGFTYTLTLYLLALVTFETSNR